MQCAVLLLLSWPKATSASRMAALYDSEVAFGHDKSYFRRDKYHFYIFIGKPYPKIGLHKKSVNLF